MRPFGVMQTLYESREKKGIKVQFNPEVANEIESYLTGLDAMMESYKDNPEILRGLGELKVKANSLLISHSPEEEIVAGIRKLTTIQGPDGKKMNVASFSKSKSVHTTNMDEFKERTLRRLNQTIRNTMALMQWDSKNEKLGAFLKALRGLDQNVSGKDLDKSIKAFVNSEAFGAYQTTKENYIKEWLKPFQEALGKNIESMSAEEMQEAMKRMKIVMSQRMNEGNLVIYPKSEELKEFNLHDQDMVNGNNKAFWINDLLADEFISFTQAVLTRFTFLLDKQFLVFQFRNEPYLYLIGFSHEAFLSAQQDADGSLLISPHVKAIIQGKDKAFRELNKTSFPSVGLYIDVLKDTLKPFFMALAEKIEFKFSKEFQSHFRMH